MTVFLRTYIQHAKNLVIISLILTLVATLSACVYKIPVQQGNIVTPEMLAQLKPGMNKRQVEYIMGTPLIKDTFEKDRWDYVFTKRIKGEMTEKYNIAVFFEDEAYSHYTGQLPKGKLELRDPERKEFVDGPATQIKPGNSEDDGSGF